MKLRLLKLKVWSNFDETQMETKKKLQERHWESWKIKNPASFLALQGRFHLLTNRSGSLQAWSGSLQIVPHSPQLLPAANKNGKFNQGGGVVLFLNLASYLFFHFPLCFCCMRLTFSYLSFPCHLLQPWHSFALFSFPLHLLQSLQGLFPGQCKSKLSRKNENH